MQIYKKTTERSPYYSNKYFGKCYIPGKKKKKINHTKRLQLHKTRKFAAFMLFY